MVLLSGRNSIKQLTSKRYTNLYWSYFHVIAYTKLIAYRVRVKYLIWTMWCHHSFKSTGKNRSSHCFITLVFFSLLRHPRIKNSLNKVSRVIDRDQISGIARPRSSNYKRVREVFTQAETFVSSFSVNASQHEYFLLRASGD